jgi:hypothetical protein
MKWMITFCVALLLLSGCAKWEHDTKRPSELRADDRDCQVESGGASQARDPLSERPSYESCMWSKGWRKNRDIWFFGD